MPEDVTAENSELILPKLSKKQEKCLSFVATFFSDKRYYPTQREIADGIGVQQPGALKIILALEKKGYLKRIQGEQRNIRLTKLARMKLEMIEKGGDEKGEG